MSGQLIIQRGVAAGGGGGGTPGGSDTQVQFNDGGAFGGDAGLTFNKTTGALTIGGNATLLGEAANVLAQRNGTNPQYFNLYSTYSGGGANYERVKVGWNLGNAGFGLQIEKGGTGGTRHMFFETPGDIYFIPSGQTVFFAAGANKFGIGAQGLFPSVTDAALDIGTTGNQLRDICLGRWLHIGETTVNPGTSDLVADGALKFYRKADKAVIAHNLGGTMNYLSIPLDGSTTTWSHSTTAP